MKDTSYNKRAKILKAIAHPARLKIIDILKKGEMCVCNIQEKIGYKMPTISRHLSVMENAGLIKGRRKGNWIYYRLLTPCVVETFLCIDKVIKTDKKCK
ncbi:MAG: metalloregulator ArsR/SmtB family transcription factor [Armatimonadota bacterium]